MSSNSSINLVNLDFDSFKSDLVIFLKSQDSFKDYNFEASNMNVLLDILAMNTYKNAFYLNMINAEGFLDSAQLRESVYSLSKELNYLPRSSISSVANVTLSFTASGESQPYIIKKGETFSTLIKSDSYVFSVADDVVLTSSNTTFTSTFNIFEGYYITDAYVTDNSVENQLLKITNENVDTSSISVLVYEDGGITPSKYTKATSLLGLTEVSTVYFIQASSQKGYEILFGDGVLGKKPKDGSTVVIDYRVTAGSIANGAKSFTPNFDPTGASEVEDIASVIVNSYGATNIGAYSVNGAEQESIESIRFYAPRYFQTQERAVTTSDYEIILKTKFPEIEAVSVYGGEDANPPQFGKVFVCVSIKNVDGLPSSKEEEYYNFIKSRSPLSIDAAFVSPNYTYVRVNSAVKYNKNITTRSASNLQAAIVLAIDEYAQNNLDNFRSQLLYSRFIRLIDDIDISIISNDTILHLYKKLFPQLGVTQNIIVDFNSALYKSYYKLNDTTMNSDVLVNAGDVHSISSSKFIFNGAICELEDDGNGIIRIVKVDNDVHEYIKNTGLVDYNTGQMQLINFTVDSYQGSALKIYARTLNKDINSIKNDILRIEADEIGVEMQEIIL